MTQYGVKPSVIEPRHAVPELTTRAAKSYVRLCGGADSYVTSLVVFLFLRDIPASTQCRATIGPPAKRHFNGASLEGHWRPTLRGLPVFPIDVSHSMCYAMLSVYMCSAIVYLNLYLKCFARFEMLKYFFQKVIRKITQYTDPQTSL